jgi:hypothetical protein
MKNSIKRNHVILWLLVLVGICLFIYGYDDGFHTMTLTQIQKNAQEYAKNNQLELSATQQMIGTKETFFFIALDTKIPQRSVAILYRKSKLFELFTANGVQELTPISTNLAILTLDTPTATHVIEYSGFNRTERSFTQEKPDPGMNPNLIPFLVYCIFAGILYYNLTKKSKAS